MAYSFGLVSVLAETRQVVFGRPLKSHTYTHTHTHTDEQTTTAYTALSIASRGKIVLRQQLLCVFAEEVVACRALNSCSADDARRTGRRKTLPKRRGRRSTPAQCQETDLDSS